MKHLHLSVLSCTMAALLGACATPSASKQSPLTNEESSMCHAMNIDSSVVLEIRKFNASKIEPFHYSLSKSFQNGQETEIDPIRLKGLVFGEKNETSYNLVFSLKDALNKKGYSIFLLENNFGINEQPDKIGVLKTTDKYEILKQIGTDGINYGITNDSMCRLIRQLDKKYALELIGASGDWCEFLIKNEPSNWMTFAQEAYKACPDIVDQGTGTVEALADEMKRTKHLYFWWD